MRSGPESGDDAAEIQFAIAELYHPIIHGKTATSAPNIDSQIICTYSLTCEEFMDGDHIEILDTMRRGYADTFALTNRNRVIKGGIVTPSQSTHSLFENYEYIVRDAFNQPDSSNPAANNHNSIHSFPRIIIAAIADLDSGECVIDRRLDLGIVKLQRLFRKWRA
jgi:hypothetical protein